MSRDKSVHWDDRDDRGEALAGGVYFCVMRAMVRSGILARQDRQGCLSHRLQNLSCILPAIIVLYIKLRFVFMRGGDYKAYFQVVSGLKCV